MSVKLRMTRIGRRHRPFFRINAIESHSPRDGRVLEKLGHYDPIEKDKDKQIVLNLERVRFWLDKGAIPSDTVSQILLKQGIKTKYAEEKTARRARAKTIARTAGRHFTKAERISAEKAAEAEAAEEKAKAAEEKAKAEKEAKAKADEKAKAKAEAEVEEKPEAEAEPQAKKEETASSEETDKSDEN
jgi:small subunit ribosomal protein S16